MPRELHATTRGVLLLVVPVEEEAVAPRPRRPVGRRLDVVIEELAEVFNTEGFLELGTGVPKWCFSRHLRKDVRVQSAPSLATIL